MTKTVKCPTCEKDVVWEAAQRWRPFCSERCRLIDLGEWVSGNRQIPGDDDEFGDPFEETTPQI